MLVTGAKQKMIDNPSFYMDLLTSVPDNYTNPYNSKIELDVKRSFPREYLHIVDEPKLNILRNILRAFSIKNTTLGYCQGYNIILSRILLVTGFNEEISFWIFVSIIEDVFPYDFFLQSAGIETDCQLSFDLLKEENPEIYECIEEKGGGTTIYSYIMKWIVSLFITDIDFDVSNAIIDLLLYFKNTKTSLAMYICIDTIFKKSANRCIELNDFEGISNVIGDILNPNTEDDKKDIIQSVIDSLMKFDHPIMERGVIVLKERNKRVEEVIERIKGSMKTKVKGLIEENNVKRNNEMVKCDLKYPCCVMDVGVKFEIEEFIVGKIDFLNSDALVIQNYFFDVKTILDKKEVNQDDISKEFTFAGLCIERRKHYCRKEN